MVNLYQILVLAIIQGLTEFLPVSSSAHLVLIPKIFGWPDQGLAFDVAIHVGTLCAVLIYFRAEIWLMCRDWFASLNSKRKTAHSRLAWAIIFGTIPVGICGLLFNSIIAQNMRSVQLIAITTIVFGILLGIAAVICKQYRDEYHLRWQDILMIGCAQAIALIPGVSRSGITLTAGLFMGLKRQAAARYSFLLSIPVIILAGMLELIEFSQHASNVDYQGLFVGFIVAAITGYACIDLFLRLLDKIGLLPFVVYRIILGAYLLMGF